MNFVSRMCCLVALVCFPAPVSNGQELDHPGRLNLRTTYFATPLKIAGDVEEREIGLIEIQGGVIGDGIQAVFRVHRADFEFNFFGDGIARENARSQDFLAKLKQLADDPDYTDRTIYKIVFADDIWLDQFSLVYFPKGQQSNRLFVSKINDKEQPDWSSQLNSMVFPLIEPHLAEQEYLNPALPDTINFTSAVFRHLSKSRLGCAEIVGKLGGDGYLKFDLSEVSFRHMVENKGMHLSYPKSQIQIVELEREDPLGKGRRIFQLIPTNGDVYIGRNPVETESFFLVTSPTIFGEHRLIIRNAKSVKHILPLHDPDWWEIVKELHSLTDPVERKAMLCLKQNCGPSCSYFTKDGSTYSIQFAKTISLSVVESLGEFKKLQWLSISSIHDYDQPEFESLKLPTSLRGITIGGTPVGDKTMNQLANCTRLKSISIIDSDDSGEITITDDGVNALARLESLDYLELTGKEITRASIETFSQFDLLGRLNIKNTGIAPADIIASAEKFPDTRVEYVQQSEYGTHSIVIIDGGRDIRIVGVLLPEEYAALSMLMQLETLSLVCSADVEMEKIAMLGSVTNLNIQLNNQISDQDLAEVAENMTNLVHLSITGCTKLTDNCVMHLKKRRLLNSLNIKGTAISAQGIIDLKQTLSDCQITH